MEPSFRWQSWDSPARSVQHLSGKASQALETELGLLPRKEMRTAPCSVYAFLLGPGPRSPSQRPQVPCTLS